MRNPLPVLYGLFFAANKYRLFIVRTLLAYIGIIALICGVYAFKARKLPETYNELGYTSIAMFICLLNWLMFAPRYFSMKSKVDRLVVWCYISLVVDLVIYALMYAPKLYIVVFKSEENTEERRRHRMRLQIMGIS